MSLSLSLTVPERWIGIVVLFGREMVVCSVLMTLENIIRSHQIWQLATVSRIQTVCGKVRLGSKTEIEWEGIKDIPWDEIESICPEAGA